MQSDQFASHEHTLNGRWNSTSGGAIMMALSQWTGGTDVTLGNNNKANAAGGNETRPKNVYVNYIIKY